MSIMYFCSSAIKAQLAILGIHLPYLVYMKIEYLQLRRTFRVRFVFAGLRLFTFIQTATPWNNHGNSEAQRIKQTKKRMCGTYR